MKDVNINKTFFEVLGIKPPMLMIDEVLDIDPQKSCHAVKHLTENDWFFPAHYPEEPIMPGMLQIEALTQAAALTVLFQSDKQLPSSGKCPILLASVDKCRFFRPVKPGDDLELFVNIDRFIMGVSQATVQGKVNGEPVCEAKIIHKIKE